MAASNAVINVRGETPKMDRLQAICNVTTRLMEERDQEAVERLFRTTMSDLCRPSPGMVALVAEWKERVVAVFFGWIGFPHGHIECFEVDWSAPKRVRYLSMRAILRVYETALAACGIAGWTAWSVNPITIKWLTRHGAHVTQQAQILSKRWR